MTQMSIEALEAPDAVRRLLQTNEVACRELGAKLRVTPPRFVATCARGSSDHAATYAKYVIETQTCTITASAAPSISSVYGVELQMSGALFITISQSGQSPDLVATATAAKKAGAFVVAVVNVTDSPLANIADQVLPLCAGPEISVAATKSYICTLAAIAQLVAHWSENSELLAALDKLPEKLRQASKLQWSSAVRDLTEADHLLVVGRAAGFGVAQEAALKFKETCMIHAEAFSAAEIQHGPMAILKNRVATLVFAQDDQTRTSIAGLIPLLKQQGGPLYVSGITTDEVVEILPYVQSMHPVLAPITLIQSFYGLVNAVSLAKGLDPDHPPLLRKVTETT